MRKASIIAMAALALLTAQCKKNEPKPEEKVMVPITGSVDFGGSKTAITTSGMITPKNGDVIYIYDNGNNVGSMTCTAQTGQQFTCSGTIQQTSIGSECTFMYLGSNNGINGETSSTISFANQTDVTVSDGKIANLNKFHVGSCKARVSETGTVTLPMATKMSIAYFQLKDEGGNAIAGQEVTISGVSATANINKNDGTLEGSGTGSITVHTDAQGKFYMALVPQSGSVTFRFAVDGKIGSNVFPNGIRECSFYSDEGSGDPLEVTVEKVKFTVSMDGNTPITVEFAPGNLYWDGSAFRFEANQWDFRTYAGGNSCIGGTVTDNGTPSGHWGLFGWSTSSTDYGMSTLTSNSDYSGDFKDWGSVAIGSDPANTWRTLSDAEWGYLLNTRTDATSLRAWKELDSGAHKGLVILPDGTDASVMESITSTSHLATYGAVFLPAAGGRSGTVVTNVGSYGHYWSSSPYGANNAYSMTFHSGSVYTNGSSRRSGYAVRLVR